MRARKPWFRKTKNAWYVEIDGKQVRLAVGRDQQKAAFEAFYKLMAGGVDPAKSNDLLLVTLCDLFLEFASKNNARSSYELYKRFLQSFCQEYPTVPVRDIKPFHVTRWLDKNSTWQGARWHAISSVKRAFSWAEQEGLIISSPVKHIRKPPINRRNRVISASELELILSSIKDRAFRNFVFAMQETGCRPGEIAAVTAEHCDIEGGVWILREHKTAKKTSRPRVIYLTPAMIELTKQLMHSQPTGPLFLNSQGRPFNKNTLFCRFRRLKQKFPQLQGISAYCYRHTFATRALENGVGIAHVAELLGHTSTDMVSRHYSHLADNVAHMRQAALRATQGNAPKPPASP